MTTVPSVMVYPRDPNPYQEDLYGELERLGVRHRYVGELTGSRSLNLLLLPAELCALRVQGFRVLHLHWLFGVRLRGAPRFVSIRRISRWYLLVVLRLSRAVGIAVVWTAHNVLPHEPVFDDDVRARQQLTAACSAVIVHSQTTRAALEAMGCEIRRVAVIRPGAPKVATDVAPPSRNRDRTHVRALFVGRIEVYKGVEDLLEVVASPAAPQRLELVIAGECRDAALASRLAALVARSRVRVEVRIGRLSDAELARELTLSDFVVLPFRDVTTSGSVDLAIAASRPVLIPALLSLAEIPEDCAWRYDGTPSGLLRALTDAAESTSQQRAAMSAAANSFASRLSWPVAARATYELFRDVLHSPVSGHDRRDGRGGARMQGPASSDVRVRK
jgi:glycosyltransferase involved in cell wall biosynthesis